MRDQFEMPVFTDLGLLAVETSEMEVAVEIAPDEAVLETAWLFSRVQVHGCAAGGKYRWHDISERHPLWTQITEYAVAYRSEELSELWRQHCAEHPECRMPTDFEAHALHGGVL